MDVSFLIAWLAGELHARFKWTDALNVILMIYILAAIACAFVYYYTNSKNLNSVNQNRYFWIVVFFALVVSCTVVNYIIATDLADVATFTNHLYLSIFPPLIYFTLALLLTAYLIRKIGKTKKKYLPTFLVKHK